MLLWSKLVSSLGSYVNIDTNSETLKQYVWNNQVYSLDI